MIFKCNQCSANRIQAVIEIATCPNCGSIDIEKIEMVKSDEICCACGSPVPEGEQLCKVCKDKTK